MCSKVRVIGGGEGGSIPAVKTGIVSNQKPRSEERGFLLRRRRERLDGQS